MKKVLLSIFCMLSFAALYAQTYTAGHISATVVVSTINHDSTYCQSNYVASYQITIDSSYVGDTVNVVDTVFGTLVGGPYVNTTGASPWTFMTATVLNEVAGDYAVPVGGGYAYFYGNITKITAGTDTLRYITIYDSLFVPNPCIYGTVSGNVFIDNNSNCVFDSGDVALNAFNISLLDSVSSPLGVIDYENGWIGGVAYEDYVQQSWMTSYTVSLPSYYAFIFPFSPCFSGSYWFNTLPQVNVNFPLQCTSSVDVQCYALSPADVRLHTPFFIDPFVSNTGCDSVSGQLTLVLDSRVVYDSALSLYPPDLVNGDTLTWNYNGLSNLSSSAYWNSFFSNIYLTLDSTVTVGDTLCFRVYTNIPPTDVNPLNNDYTVCLPVVYSYDPNEKDVTPKGTGPQGYIPATTDTMSYNIHFQNTGSDYAYNVTITDTLDPHVNPSTFRVIGASANMTPQWLAPGIVQFNFANIFLPDSGTSQAGSQGEVRYSVVLNAGLAPGTQIKNTAYIYFDSNPPVITNTTLNTIATPSNVQQITTPVKVYPNPATDNITVENLNGGELTILSINGQTILDQVITNNKTTIDVSGIASGIYILKTVSNDNTTTTKFVKY